MSIRNILMSLSTGLAVLALSLSPAGPARAVSADGARMDLPAPDKKGGMPLMQALAERHSRLYRRAPVRPGTEQPALGHLGREPARRPPHRAFGHEPPGSDDLRGAGKRRLAL